MTWIRTAGVLLLVGSSQTALGHGGNPAQAVFLEPSVLGAPVDQSYLVEWIDAGDPPPPTGSATVSIHYTTEIPETFPLGTIPDTLTGTVIVTRKEELDGDTFLWDVSGLPSAHYWLWSRVDEPPEEMSPQYIRFPPAPLTVLHPGDTLGPAMAITRPQSEFATADEFYNIEYTSWHMSENARVRFEAALEVFGEERQWHLIADNIPAQQTSVLGWDTSLMPDGDWVIRATIQDCDGRETTLYARYFLFIIHLDPVPVGPEPGIPDGGSIEEFCALDFPDTGTPIDVGTTTPDAGEAPVDSGSMLTPEPTDCGCESGRTGDGPFAFLVWIGMALLFLRRRAA